VLTITYIPVIEERYAARLKKQALRIDPDAVVHAEDPGPQGAIGWALPGIIVLVIGIVSTTILQEAGKDIYKGLKKLVAEAYGEASRSPYEWHSHRKEPTLGGTANDGARPQRAAEKPVASPPLKLTLKIDDWNGRLSFVFPGALAPEQVAAAYSAMQSTARTVLDYSAYLFAQLRSKRARPELYQGTMPASIWEEQFQYESSEASALLHAVFVFDAEAGVWGRVN
jgi:hypothetical protein